LFIYILLNVSNSDYSNIYTQNLVLSTREKFLNNTRDKDYDDVKTKKVR